MGSMSAITEAQRLRETQLQALGALVDVGVADELGRRFAAEGFELYLVGGTVRDLLRGSPDTGDLDFATSALPDDTQRLLEGWAEDLWLTGARFGTVSAARAGHTVEVTTFRSDDYRPGSRHPAVRFGDDIAADLARRDFTINAVAVSVPDRRVVDPHGGWEDLRQGVLRTPIEAKSSFADDPLRMIRMARFVATLGFEPDDDAVGAATAMSSELKTVSAERIRAELDKLVLGPGMRAGMDLLVHTGLAEVFLPELPALRMQRDPAHHHKDVYAHTLAVVEACPADDLVLRLAALLHDIGKPATRQFHAGGTVSFHHHDVVGARMARHRLRELRYPKDVIADVAHLVRLHLRFHGYSQGEWSDAAVRRYVHDAGDDTQLRRLNLLTRADVTTRDAGKKRRFAQAMDHLETRIDILAQQEQVQAVRPALDGTQMMAYLGIPPGPLVGMAWDHLKDKALELGPVSAEEGYALLDDWAQEQGIEVRGDKVPPKPKKDDSAAADH
ncbi:CCA tRNA nucleotidyltransferase [soil metagenome]